MALIMLKLFRLVVLVEESEPFGIVKLFLLLMLLMFPKPLLLRIKICNVGGMAWLLTAVYASPCNTMRSTLWDHLVSISTMHNQPWIISGDFNEILSMNEKKCGSLNGRIGGFKRWFNYSAMIDMRFQGSACTWTNNKVKKHLDRCIYDRDWRLLFADAKVIHLARMSSPF